ncbi:MAG: hypothetical protein ACYC5O_22435 [Anaerolineae bacterium]
MYAYLRIDGNRQLLDQGTDYQNGKSHAAWTTRGGSGWVVRQEGNHYFRTAGWQDANFWTQDIWPEV